MLVKFLQSFIFVTYGLATGAILLLLLAALVTNIIPVLLMVGLGWLVWKASQ